MTPPRLRAHVYEYHHASIAFFAFIASPRAPVIQIKSNQSARLLFVPKKKISSRFDSLTSREPSGNPVAVSLASDARFARWKLFSSRAVERVDARGLADARTAANTRVGTWRRRPSVPPRAGTGGHARARRGRGRADGVEG